MAGVRRSVLWWAAATVFTPRVRGLVRPSMLRHAPRITHCWMSTTDETDEQEILDRTRQWLRQTVIGLNLCPFAERPLREGRLKMDVIPSDQDEEILGLVLAELMLRVDTPGTSILICPNCHPGNFQAYLNVLDMIDNGLMVEHEDLLQGAVLVAPFHPLFQFEGSSPTAVDNWTNRSPYPIFHILRQEEVASAAYRLDGDASKVWQRNVDLLAALGEALDPEELQTLMAGEPIEHPERVREILQQFRVKV